MSSDQSSVCAAMQRDRSGGNRFAGHHRHPASCTLRYDYQNATACRRSFLSGRRTPSARDVPREGVTLTSTPPWFAKPRLGVCQLDYDEDQPAHQACERICGCSCPSGLSLDRHGVPSTRRRGELSSSPARCFAGGCMTDTSCGNGSGVAARVRHNRRTPRSIRACGWPTA